MSEGKQSAIAAIMGWIPISGGRILKVETDIIGMREYHLKMREAEANQQPSKQALKRALGKQGKKRRK